MELEKRLAIDQLNKIISLIDKLSFQQDNLLKEMQKFILIDGKTIEEDILVGLSKKNLELIDIVGNIINKINIL